MNMKLLKTLCEAPGLPGAEEPVKDIIRKEFGKLTKEVTEDALGNIIAHIPGKGPKLVLDAHTDEVGFMVNHWTRECFTVRGLRCGVKSRYSAWWALYRLI
jgi:endoglucanase